MRVPVPVAGAVLAVLMLGALAVTLVHTLRQVRGVRSEDDLRGALYGWSWFLGFGALTAVLITLGRRASTRPCSTCCGPRCRACWWRCST